MENKIILLKKWEELLFDVLWFTIEKYSTEINSKIKIWPNKTSILEVRLINTVNKNALWILISEGLNVDCEQFYSIRYYIQKIDDNNNKISDFSLDDYCVERKLDIKFEWFYTGVVDFNKKLHDFLQKSILILELEEIQTVLYTDYWIEIKPNMIPYK
jgi:hypothetical protein